MHRPLTTYASRPSLRFPTSAFTWLRTVTIATGAIFTLGATAFAQTVWTGAVNNSVGNTNNWTNGLPTSESNPGTIASGTPTFSSNLNGYRVTQTGGAVQQTGIPKSMSNGFYNLQGGSLDLAGNGLQIASNFSFTVEGGSFTRSLAGAGFALSITTTSSSFNVLGGSVNLGSGNILNQDGSMVISSATVTTGSYQFTFGANDTFSPTLTFQNGGSLIVTDDTGGSGVFSYESTATADIGQINFASGASLLSADSWTEATEFNFDFVTGAEGSRIVIGTGYFTEAEWIDQWTAGRLTVDSSNSGSFEDYFTVADGTLTFTGLSEIPEPGSCALLAGIAALGLVALQRRRA
jgi:hypothetical protein